MSRRERKPSDVSVGDRLATDQRAVLILGDHDQRIVHASPAAARLLECSISRLQSMSLWDLSPAVLPSGDPVRTRASDYLARAVAGEHVEFEWILQKPSNGRLRCLAHMRPRYSDRDGLLTLEIEDLDAKDPSSRACHLLTGLTHAAAAARDVPDLMECFLRQFCDVLNWPYGEIWLKNSDLGVLELASASVAPTGSAALQDFFWHSRQIQFPARTGLPGRVFATGKTEWLDLDTNTQGHSFRRRKRALRAGLRTALGAAIDNNGERLGVLVLMHDLPQPHSLWLMDLLRSSTGLVASLIDYRIKGQRLTDQNAMLKTIISHVPCSLYRRVLNADGSITYPYVLGELLYGLAVPGEPGGDSMRHHYDEAITDTDRHRFYAALKESAALLQPFEIEIEALDKQGRKRALRVYSDPLKLADGAVAWDSFAIDVTDEVTLKSEIQRVGNIDAVTGVPNRRMFGELAQGHLARHDFHKAHYVIAVLDVHRFGRVNLALGVASGDALLKAIAERFQDALRSGELVCRILADEFALLLQIAPGVTPERAVHERMAALCHNFRIAGEDIPIAYTAGVVAVRSRPDTSIEVLLHRASLAKSRQKLQRTPGIVRFDPSLDAPTSTLLSMEQDLRVALEQEQLYVHYQPQAAPDFSRVLGFEALLRWSHPERGMVPPNQFVALAEEAQLIDPLFRYVLDHVCRQIVSWRRQGIAVPPVSINLSPVQINSGSPIWKDVTNALTAHELSPSALKIEITESAMLQNLENTADLLRRLRDARIPVVLDDFGVGYSSLGYLAELPIDEIKIDRAFVRSLDTSPQGRTVLGLIVTLAHALDKTAVVEGVETDTHVSIVRELGVDAIQGYFFSRPIPAADAGILLEEMQG